MLAFLQRLALDFPFYLSVIFPGLSYSMHRTDFKKWF